MADLLQRLRNIDLMDDHARLEAADEIERLREKVEILEAEIRVMRKLPSAIDAALNIHEREGR